jgi:hypothetical protein
VGILLAFFAGWATAAKADRRTNDEVIEALKAVRDSEEVGALLHALRNHAGYSIRELGTRILEAGDGRPMGVPEIISRVRQMMTPAHMTSPGSAGGGQRPADR